MARLRDPNGGCPWDLEQNFQTLTRYTIEEAYEVADAAQKLNTGGPIEDLVEELGDLLLQVVFYAQIGKDEGTFTFEDVARGVARKLVSRHPHVFGDKTAANASEVISIWEGQKDKEKAAKKESVLDDIPLALPPLQRSEKLMKRSGKIGFTFEDAEAAKRKFLGELKEFEDTPNKDEYGDVLFSFIAWARLAVPDETSSDEALAHANRKFERRFRVMEKMAKAQKPANMNEWVALWNRAKKDSGG